MLTFTLLLLLKLVAFELLVVDCGVLSTGDEADDEVEGVEAVEMTEVGLLVC